MVVVDLGALLVGLAVLPLVVAVVPDDGDGVAEMLLEMARERGLAGAGAAGDADHHGIHPGFPPFLLSIQYITLFAPLGRCFLIFIR